MMHAPSKHAADCMCGLQVLQCRSRVSWYQQTPPIITTEGRGLFSSSLATEPSSVSSYTQIGAHVAVSEFRNITGTRLL